MVPIATWYYLKLETKMKRAIISGAKAVIIMLLFLTGCSYSVRPKQEIESIDTIHVFYYNNEIWLRGITPFEPDTTRLIPAGTCVKWLGDSCNFPSYIMIDTTYKPASRINKFINRGLYSK